MASHSVALSKHATLSAATVDTITLTVDYQAVEVKNRGTSGDIYFTTDSSAPTSAGDNTYFVGPGEGLVVRSGYNVDTVKLISAGTPAYSVTGVL